MKSEIAWLMEAFLEEDPKKVRVMIKDRMAAITSHLTTPQIVVPPGQFINQHHPNRADVEQDPVIVNQSPSMQRIMRQNPDLVKAPVPVTPAAAQALAARQALIAGASEKRADGSKRKF